MLVVNQGALWAALLHPTDSGSPLRSIRGRGECRFFANWAVSSVTGQPSGFMASSNTRVVPRFVTGLTFSGLPSASTAGLPQIRRGKTTIRPIPERCGTFPPRVRQIPVVGSPAPTGPCAWFRKASSVRDSGVIQRLHSRLDFALRSWASTLSAAVAAASVARRSSR
jgi:hypothetical protein